MVKIVGETVYDTQKSTMDKKFTYGAPGDDTGYEETLYITFDGKYFIYTNGGKRSRYTHDDITPISREQVKGWIMSH